MKVWACVLNDIKLAFRNYYIYFTFGMAVIFVLLVLFVIPEQSNQENHLWVYVEQPEMMEQLEDSHWMKDVLTLNLVNSTEELEEKLEQDRQSMGLKIRQDGQKMVFTYVLQGYENEEMLNIMEASMKAQMAQAMGFTYQSDRIILAPDHKEVADNQRIIPVFLIMESALMGLFMAAAYLFIDKEDGTIRSFAVSPGKVWQYLLSKVIVFMFFGWVSGLIVTISLLGFGFNYFQFMLMLMVYSMFGTVLGLILASFFDTINSAMIWIVLSMLVLALATVSYFAPSFSPFYIQLLPTYHMLFGMRDVLFGMGDVGGIYMNIGVFAVITLLLFFVAERLHRNRLAR